MLINETYRTWIQRICELRLKQRKTQVLLAVAPFALDGVISLIARIVVI